MSIKSDVAELESIRSEIKYLNQKKKNLREKEKQVESRISMFLKSKDQIGVKHQGLAVVMEAKEVSGPKKTKDRNTDAISVLERYGIREAEKVLAELMNARRGDKIITEKLSVKKLTSQP